MSRLPQNSLKSNPFTTYRDPETGRWIVVQDNVAYINQRVPSTKRRAQPQSLTPFRSQTSAMSFGVAQSVARSS
ncbi:MAG: hypothetical protein WBA10_02425, partial [Elainellaceae cyanobacterium]